MKAIVTGGNRGIGLEISKNLLQKGYEVHVLSRSGLAAAQDGISSWITDVSDFLQTRQIIERIGTPDVLINNAGIMNSKALSEYSSEDILHILNVNLISAVRLSAEVAEQMAERGGGRIVSMGSIAGEIGHPDIWYGISKAGMMNAMRSLARSFGARGVLANSVAPGPVDTDMMKNIPEDRKMRLKAATISQRFCTAEEVASTVCWLATEAPAFINGEVIDMNNGANYR
ncbi:SDR family NAD(P)-dependent oxidoreductase [Undibacterium parvum]|uniref:SDR family oxidoreductase n=2 Tax=Undibacterium TaxID=401469 RepID=A0A6M4A692_9BURK|nr:SDR family oxidoreductase [Undibacterium parvum]AZP12423.1 SDR family oxidoreductase [Undibacterium parvum]QJQ06683.1 SDR family oxidoreductase [Undibacterium piscinae]